MNQKPLISIAMATYNGEKFLREQLDSIYAQSYKNIEVIVTDDSSSDDTVSILKEYHQKNGLKYFINEENLGYLKNFEKAISLCSGDYIALSDQDDIWLPHKLETLYKTINGKALVFSDAKLVDGEGRVFAESFHLYQKVYIPEYTKHFYYLVIKNFITGCTVLFSRKLLKEIIPIPKSAIHHDWWIAFLGSLQGGIEYVREPLVLYRQHGGNSIGAEKSSFFKNVIKEARFVFERKKKRENRNLKKIKRLQCFREKMDSLNGNNVKEKEFLEQAILFYSSKNFFKKLAFALNNKKVLFPAQGKIGRLLFALMKGFF